MKKPLAVSSFRVKNFKAIRDSGHVRFTPLTALIGNNGSGKSSLVEGLEMLQAIVSDGLDRAVEPWRGFEHIWNQAVPHTHRTSRSEIEVLSNAMQFSTNGTVNGRAFTHNIFVSTMAGEGELAIVKETYSVRNVIDLDRKSDMTGSRKDHVSIVDRGTDPNIGTLVQRISSGGSILGALRHLAVLDLPNSFETISEWQFLSMAPQSMVSPLPQRRTIAAVRLARDGSNIAEYLLSIRDIDPTIIDGIVASLRFVLPYAVDVQPSLTSELERTVYLQLAEQDFKLPGWLLSSGTIRVLALLALFRHPNPPPLIVIEEVENGLDPRSIGLLVEEIRSTVQSGETQVIITTHSPYLLNLLPLSSIVLVERDAENAPVFTRPADDASLKAWSDRFSPGQLYTMGRLSGTVK